MKSSAIVVKIWYSASFQEKHFQKIRPGPENRFRLYRVSIQPKQKKTRGTDQNPAQPRPETNSAYRLTLQKYKKKGNVAQNKPIQTSSAQKRQIPQSNTQKSPQSNKTIPKKNISSFSGPTMRMESVPEGTPSLPFFKNWCFMPWKSTIYKKSKIFTFVISE